MDLDPDLSYGQGLPRRLPATPQSFTETEGLRMCGGLSTESEVLSLFFHDWAPGTLSRRQRDPGEVQLLVE